MTNLEALLAAVNYPVDTIKLQKILVDRGLQENSTYAGKSKEFDIATADLYVLIVTSANISEGDFQISATDKSNYMKLASGIYSKWGIDNPLERKSIIKNRSNYW